MATTTVDLGLVKGSTWYCGTDISGTDPSGSVYPSSGIRAALLGDLYLHTERNDVYRCTVSGAADAAVWAYVTTLRGADLTISGVTAGAGLLESTSGKVKTLMIHMPYLRDMLFPPGRSVLSRGESPAAVVGGTWTLRPDTHMFMGYNVYERVS